MDPFIAGFRKEFARYHSLAEQALSRMDDEGFFQDPGTDANSAAILVKHMGGNLKSRWTDFLHTDGEKEDRDRDSEFELYDADTREALMASWSEGWGLLFDTLGGLGDRDLNRDVTLRGQPLTVCTALARQLAHAAYHSGQIVALARQQNDDWPSLSIPRGQSTAFFERTKDE